MGITAASRAKGGGFWELVGEGVPMFQAAVRGLEAREPVLPALPTGP